MASSEKKKADAASGRREKRRGHRLATRRKKAYQSENQGNEGTTPTGGVDRRSHGTAYYRRVEGEKGKKTVDKPGRKEKKKKKAPRLSGAIQGASRKRRGNISPFVFCN